MPPGQAASALCVMDILQVHLAKALKQMYKGSTDQDNGIHYPYPTSF